MAERTDQRTRSAEDPADLLDDTSVGPDPSTGPDPEATARKASTTSRLRNRITEPFRGLFSIRLFLVVLALTLVGTVLAGAVIPLGGLAGFIGIATVGFGVGLADANSRYLEFLLAGAITAGVGTLLDHLVLAAVGLGLPLVALGVGAGSLAGVVGHYFGRDLRDGFTRDL